VVKDLTVTGSFSGRQASALALYANGDLTVKNVVVNATVRGRDRAAAFIGKDYVRITYNSSVPESFTLSFVNCSTASSSISGGGDGWSSTVGGFFGQISGTRTSAFHLTFENCINGGTIDGSLTQAVRYSNTVSVGGFIGQFYSSYNGTVDFVGCSNNGVINSRSTVLIESAFQYVGGYIGSISESFGTHVTISNSRNAGLVNATASSKGIRKVNVGGFVGFLDDNQDLVLKINGSTNAGKVLSVCKGDECYSYAGGFIGDAYTILSYYNNSLNIANSLNAADVEVANGTSCGIVCTDPSFKYGVLSEIRNCINKNSVSGVSAYGFANVLTRADTLVNLGTVTSSSSAGKACSFWGSLEKNGTSLYGLSTAVKCGNDTFTTVTLSAGSKYVVGDENLDFVLNKNSFLGRFGMFWDDSLEVSASSSYEFFVVQYGYPYFDAELVTSTSSPKLHSSEDWYLTGDCCKTKVESSTLFNKDVELARCFSLSVLDKNVILEYGNQIGAGCVSDIVPYFSQYHLVDSAATTDAAEFSVNSSLSHDTSLVSCHKVVITGDKTENFTIFVAAGGSSFVDDGKVFGDKDLLMSYFKSSFLADNSSGKLLANNSVVTADTDVRACYRLVVNNLENGTWYIQHGRPLLKSAIIDLSESDVSGSSVSGSSMSGSIVSRSDPSSSDVDDTEDDGVYGDKDLLKSLFEQYHLIDIVSSAEYSPRSVLEGDMVVYRCHRVVIHDATNYILYGEPGTVLGDTKNLFGQVAFLEYGFRQYHIVDKSMDKEFTRESAITEDLYLYFGYKVEISGEFNQTIFIEKGKTLSSCSVLEPYLNDTETYSLRNTDKTTSVYTAVSVITSDVSISVVGNCEVFTTQDKCKSFVTCEWNSRSGVCKSVTDVADPSNTGLVIALPIVGAVALVGIFFAIFIPLHLKKKKDQESEK